MLKETNIVLKQNRKITEVVLHIVVWLLLFCFPLLFSTAEMPKSSMLFFRVWMPIFFSAVLFYINYFVLIDAFIFKRKKVWFILINLILFALFIFAIDFLREWLSPPRGGRGSFRDSKYYYYYSIRQTFSFALTVGVAFAIKAISKWQQTEVERKNLENENLKSELKHLKYQIQPHFFLNTLNNIYALTDISTERAKEAIHNLGKLMRYLLYDTNTELVSLSKEIEFLEKYINLMQMRLRPDVKVTYSFPEKLDHILLPPLLLIPLVENAFKHGVSATQKSFINIKLVATESEIIFQVRNSNFPKNDSDQGGSGIGLENLVRRLNLLYGKEYIFEQKVLDEVHYSDLKLKV